MSWPWLNRRRGEIARLVRKLKASTAVPYYYAHSVPPGFVSPEDFEATRDKGLIAWHRVSEGDTSRIISYWQDQQHCNLNRAWFEGALGMTGSKGWGGSAGDIHGNEPTWRPSSLKEFLLVAAALAGAFTAIWDAGDKYLLPLWTTPSSEVSFAAPRENLSEGEDRRISITARNATQFVPAYLSASAKLVEGGAFQSVQLDQQYGQWVAPGADETLTATLRAPKLSSANSIPADYRLSVSVDARAWRFGRVKTSQSGELPVRVWPTSFGWTRQLRPIPQDNPKFLSASGTLYSGKAFPNGLLGIVTMVVPESVDLYIDALQPFRVIRELNSPPADSMKTVLMYFVSPPLEEYTEYPFQLTIRAAEPLQKERVQSIEPIFKTPGD